MCWTRRTSLGSARPRPLPAPSLESSARTKGQSKLFWKSSKRQPHAMQKIRITRIGSQGSEAWISLHVKQPCAPFRERFFQQGKRLVLLSDHGIEAGNHRRVDVGAFGLFFQKF